MVLAPFEQPVSQRRYGQTHVRNLTSLPVHSDASTNGMNSVDRSMSAEELYGRPCLNEEIDIGRILVVGMEKVSSERIHVGMLSDHERRQVQWCNQVQKLKHTTTTTTATTKLDYGQATKIGQPVTLKDVKKSVADRRRVCGTLTDQASSAVPPYELEETLNRSADEEVKSRKTVNPRVSADVNTLMHGNVCLNLDNQSKRDTTIPIKHTPFGKFRMSQSGTVPGQRQVRFNVGITPKDSTAARTRLDSSTSTGTSSNGKKSQGSLQISCSNHICSRAKISGFAKHDFQRLFWSRVEVKHMQNKAHLKATLYRSKNPAIAKQVGLLFEETCGAGSNQNTTQLDEDAEDNEEIMRSFLQDWAASDVRGLEEDVTGRNIFAESRKMGVQGVLAYQESIREKAKLGRCNEESNQMAELIRSRSESISQRARMFALYIALGDALVVSANDGVGLV